MQEHDESAPPQDRDFSVDQRKPWLRATIAAMEDGLVLTDATGCITFVNPAAQAITGWTLEQARGAPLDARLQFIDARTRQLANRGAIQALREGTSLDLPTPTLLIGKDAREQPIEGSFIPVRDADGEVTGLVVLLRDLTGAARAIEEGIHYGEAILATLRVPFLVLDRELRVKTANRAFYKTFQLSPTDTEQQLLYEVENGDWDILQLREALKNVIARNQPFEEFEVGHVFRALGHRNLVVSARCFHRVGNHTDWILLAMEDVTERKRAQAALENSEQRYRRLFETAKDGILILDAASGRIIDSNPFIKELLGYTLDELRGKELWEIGLFEDKRANQGAYRELQQSGYMRYEYLRMRSKIGERVVVDLVSNSYREEGKEVVQCNLRDITERSRLEQETQAQAEELAELNRRKDEFLAMLSHELRNPLAAIHNAVELLRLQSEDGTRQEQARLIVERQLGQLTHLVDDLLEISRITSGRIRLRLEKLDMRATLLASLQSGG